MDAFLEGSVLYIGTQVFGEDLTPHEAAEVVAELQELPGAPTGVRIFSRPRSKRRKSHTGWPMDLAPKFQYGNTSGWPE